MTKTGTPICPACGAKFSHSGSMLQCTKCGIPDEVVAFGPRAIARWKKQKERETKTKRQAKKVKWAGHKKSLRRKKHGRPV